MRTVFMGSDSVALPVLEHLRANAPAGVRIAAVYTQPDRPAGRGQRVRPNAIKVWALAAGIPVRQPPRFGPEESEFLRREAVELVLVMAYGQLLPAAVLDAVPYGFLNLHASLLPRLRGASPIQTAVACGLARSGVSLMRIIARLDAGPVADAEPVPIGPDDTAQDLAARLARACLPLVDRCLPRLAQGRLEFAPQDEARASYCRILEKSDAWLDFHAPAAALAARVRAFQPWPGTTFPWQGQDIRVLAAAAEPGAAPGGAAPGMLLDGPPGSVRIACGAGVLRVLALQRPGGRPLAAAEFVRGFPLPAGALLQSRPMRPLESPVPFPRNRRRQSRSEPT